MYVFPQVEKIGEEIREKEKQCEVVVPELLT